MGLIVMRQETTNDKDMVRTEVGAVWLLLLDESAD